MDSKIVLITTYFLFSLTNISLSQNNYFSVSGQTIFCRNSETRISGQKFKVFDYNHLLINEFKTDTSQVNFKITNLKSRKYSIEYFNCYDQKVVKNFTIKNKSIRDLELCLDTYIDSDSSIFENNMKNNGDIMSIHNYQWKSNDKINLPYEIRITKTNGQFYYDYCFKCGDELIYRKKRKYKFPFKFTKSWKLFKLSEKQLEAVILFEKKCNALSNAHGLANTKYSLNGYFIDIYYKNIHKSYALKAGGNIHPLLELFWYNFPKIKRDYKKLLKKKCHHKKY